MHYLDTNILVYSVINQDPFKMEQSQAIIHDLFAKQSLLLSPLSLQELIFTLSKLKISKADIEKAYLLFREFCEYEIDRDIIDDAFKISAELSFGRNINDIIHLKFAERYAVDLSTYDKDFNALKSHSTVNIILL